MLKVVSTQAIKNSKDARYLAFRASHNLDRTLVISLRFHEQSPARLLPTNGRILVFLFPGIDLDLTIDLSIVERGLSHHPRVPGVGPVYNSGPVLKMAEMKAISFCVEDPPAGLKLKIGKHSLNSNFTPVLIHTRGPRVDESGLPLWLGWPGKEASPPASMSTKLARRSSALPSEVGSARSKGLRWEVIQEKGRYWLKAPDGKLVFSIGMNCLRPEEPCPVTGMEKLFTKLPPKQGKYAEAWKGDSISLYSANLIKTLGPDWKNLWAKQAVTRLAQWGFNTIGNWSSAVTYDRQELYYTLNASHWNAPHTPEGWGLFNGFPDVYSPEFETHCDKMAKQCVRPLDKYLIGYFLLNEPGWQRVDFHLAKLAESTDRAPWTKLALKEWLKKKYGNQARKPTETDYDQFRDLMVERFFKVVCEAMRRHDPNHLLLGVRFYGNPPGFLVKAMKFMDLVSVNNYEPSPNPTLMADLHKATGKPLLLGEFHFGATDRGLAWGLVGVKNQKERGAGYSYYMEQAAKIPYCVGAHWFQYTDQSVLGRFDGENYNIGLVDVTDKPYEELVSAAKAANTNLHDIHSGKLKPSARPPKLVKTGISW